jgi:hypothetical protein
MYVEIIRKHKFCTLIPTETDSFNRLQVQELLQEEGRAGRGGRSRHVVVVGPWTP